MIGTRDGQQTPTGEIDDIAYRRLMCAVVLQALHDYYPNSRLPKESNNQTARRKIAAARYIFNGGQESEMYVFGFVSVCRFINLSPSRARKAIKARRQELTIALAQRLVAHCRGKHGP